MRILIVSTGIVGVPPRGGGGIEIIVYELACRMARRGHTVYVADRGPGDTVLCGRVGTVRVATPGPCTLIRHSMSRRVAIGLNMAASLWFGAAAAPLIAGIGADVVHFNHPPSSIAMLLSRRVADRSVYTVHNALYLGGLSTAALASENGLELRLVRRARVAVATHHSLAAAVSAMAGRSDIRVVYNGVDTVFFSPTRAREAGRLRRSIRSFAEKHGFLAVYAGPVMPEKGPDIAIKALAALKSIDPVLYRETGLIIAGPGGGYGAGGETPYYRGLRLLAERLGVAGRVLFTGELARDELAIVLAAAAATVQPFRIYESLSMVSIESFSSGTPVVVPCSGDAGRIVSLSGAGVCYKRSRPVLGVAEALTVIAGDTEGYGKRARRLALEVFDWERVVDRYLEVYREAAAT